MVVAEACGRSRGFADSVAQLRHMRGKFVRPRRRFAAPKRNVGRSALRVLHQHASRLHAADSPGRVSEQHDVARQTLDGKIFVHGADNRVIRRGHNRVKRILRNRAAAGDGRKPASTAAAQALIHLVVEQVGAEAAAPGRDALRKHGHNGFELAAR